MKKKSFSVAVPIQQALMSAALLFLSITLCVEAFGDDAAAKQQKCTFQVKAVLGFSNSNAGGAGSLTVEHDLLRFENKKQQVTLVSLASIESVVLSEQNKQVGGVPMTLGKAAVPFGGGRVVSLISHKKYDDVAITYRDQDGGIHGVIYELPAGEGLKLEKLIVSHGMHVGTQVSSNGAADQEMSNGSK